MIQQQTRVSEIDSLVAENVTIGSRVNIKESVIGVGCSIGSGARLTRCLLMDGCTVGENVTLTGCILGKRCKIEGGGPKDEDKTRLTECEVQPGYVVKWGSKFFALYLSLTGMFLTFLSQLKSRTKSSCTSRALARMMVTRLWMMRICRPMMTLHLHRSLDSSNMNEDEDEHHITSSSSFDSRGFYRMPRFCDRRGSVKRNTERDSKSLHDLSGSWR
jgi:hypothetical protein